MFKFLRYFYLLASVKSVIEYAFVATRPIDYSTSDPGFQECARGCVELNHGGASCNGFNYALNEGIRCSYPSSGFDFELKSKNSIATGGNCQQLTTGIISNLKCQDNWKLFNGYCYYYSGVGSYSYGWAVDACRVADADLVSIHSEAENLFVTDLAWQECGHSSDGWQNGATIIGGLFNPTAWKITGWTDGTGVDYIAPNLTPDYGTQMTIQATSCNGEPSGQWVVAPFNITNAPGFVCKMAVPLSPQ